MVDREARDRYVDVINRYLAGEINNHGFDWEAQDLRDSTEDQAVDDVYSVLWFTYCDIYTHDAHRDGPEAVEVYRRAAAFLRTDLEYSWPPVAPGLKFGLRMFMGLFGLVIAAWATYEGSIVAGVIGVGLLVLYAWGKYREGRQRHRILPEIDWDVWPFADREQMLEHYQPTDSEAAHASRA